jgi:hypothetical protein
VWPYEFSCFDAVSLLDTLNQPIFNETRNNVNCTDFSRGASKRTIVNETKAKNNDGLPLYNG